MCFARLGPGFIRKHYTRLERFARDEHSSLLRITVVNFFIGLAPEERKRLENVYKRAEIKKMVCGVSTKIHN
jgi:hypothetical protein